MVTRVNANFRRSAVAPCSLRIAAIKPELSHRCERDNRWIRALKSSQVFWIDKLKVVFEYAFQPRSVGLLRNLTAVGWPKSVLSASRQTFLSSDHWTWPSRRSPPAAKLWL